MSLKVSVILRFMLVILFFLGITMSFAQNLPGPLKSLAVEVQSERMINQVNQKVGIIIYLKNTSDEPIEVIEPAIDEKSLMVDIIMPDGRKDKLLDIYGVTLDTIRLYPKKRIKFKTNFIPEQVGNYEIKTRYNGYNNEAIEAIPVNIFVVTSKIKTKQK